MATHPPVVLPSPNISNLDLECIVLRLMPRDFNTGSRLGQIIALAFAVAEVRAELEALRECDEHRDYLAYEPHQVSEFPSYESTPTSRNEVKAQEDINQQHEQGWKHVAGIKASKSVVIRDWNVTARLNFCPRCWVARVQKEYFAKYKKRKNTTKLEDISTIACLDCCNGLSKLDEVEADRDAKRTKALKEETAEYKQSNNDKLAARGWVGYSPEETDLDIIGDRGRDTAETMTKFDKKLWNKSPRAKGKWRIQ